MKAVLSLFFDTIQSAIKISVELLFLLLQDAISVLMTIFCDLIACFQINFGYI